MISLPPTLEFPLPDLHFVLVEGGEYNMGDETGDLWEPCRPVHPVRVSSFYMGKFQVTQRLWHAVTGKNPSAFKGEMRPVEQVSWNDADEFIQSINARQEVNMLLEELDLPGAGFRLPTEAEWEYAACGGRYSQGYVYAGSDKLKQVGWYIENSGNETHEAGLLLANELGLHDMSGNVWEWCEDWFDEKYYEKCLEQGVVENPKGAGEGVHRVARGGSYFNDAVFCRPALRIGDAPGDRDDLIGFRLVLPFQSVG